MASMDDDWGPPPQHRPWLSRSRSLLLAVAGTAVGYGAWREREVRMVLLCVVGWVVVSFSISLIFVLGAFLGLVTVRIAGALFALFGRLARPCRRPGSKPHPVDDAWA